MIVEVWLVNRQVCDTLIITIKDAIEISVVTVNVSTDRCMCSSQRDVGILLEGQTLSIVSAINISSQTLQVALVIDEIYLIIAFTFSGKYITVEALTFHHAE